MAKLKQKDRAALTKQKLIVYIIRLKNVLNLNITGLDKLSIVVVVREIINKINNSEFCR